MDTVDAYIAMVPHLNFTPVDIMTWRQIQEEGIDYDRRNRVKWTVALLPISAADEMGLRGYDEAVLEKFKCFSCRLFTLSNGRIAKLFDYSNGQIRLVKKVQ